MSIGGKTVGQDIRVVINTINGVLEITPDMVGKFTFKPISERKNWLPVTGQRESAVLPQAHAGEVSIIRKGPILERFYALFEASYYQGVSIQYGTILRTVKEADGSITQWLYSGVTFQVTDLGDYAGDEFVMQQLSWEAESCVEL